MYTLITGASGFIARHLAEKLVSLDRKVVGLGHGAPSSVMRDLIEPKRWFNSSIGAETLKNVYQIWGAPEAIYHLAGGSSVIKSIRSPSEDFIKTVNGTIELLEWTRCYALETPVVIVSSAAVYGAGYIKPIIEKDICKPCSPYGFHKRMVELAAESYGYSYGVKSSIVRFFSLYGEGLKKQLVWDLCERAAEQSTKVYLDGDGSEARCFMHVSDATELLIKTEQMANSIPFIINGSTGIQTTTREVAELVLMNYGSSSELVFTGHKRPGDPSILLGSSYNSEKQLDFRAKVNIQAGIKNYVTWHRNQLLMI